MLQWLYAISKGLGLSPTYGLWSFFSLTSINPHANICVIMVQYEQHDLCHAIALSQ